MPDNAIEQLHKNIRDQIAFLKERLSDNPLVFEIKHANDHGVLLELKPAKKLYFINLMGRHAKDSLNYSSELAKELEGNQPYCAIGSYGNDVDLKQAIALADKGTATFHTSPLGVPINRTVEEIIKMDYGMKQFGHFLS